MPTILMSSPLRAVLTKGAAGLTKAFGFETVGDLLRHYPRRYAQRGVLTPLSGLRVDDHVTVMAEIAKVEIVPMRQRRGQMVKVVITDGTGRLDVTFFNQHWRFKQLQAGARGLFAG